jgi:hypothetical protein
MPPSPSQSRAADAQAVAPRMDAHAGNAPRTGDTAASPMGIDSPLTQGYKRTADGAVKGSVLAAHSLYGNMAAHKRNKSMDTHSGTRIGEVRDRILGYGLQGANACPAFRPTQNASFVRHGQSAEWLGKAIA